MDFNYNNKGIERELSQCSKDNAVILRKKYRVSRRIEILKNIIIRGYYLK